MNKSLLIGTGVGALILILMMNNASASSSISDEQDPKDPKDPNQPPPLKKEDLIISPDCKSFVFGDKTGLEWWIKIGRPVAENWIAEGYKNPLNIALGMLSGVTQCLVTYPQSKDFSNRRDLEIARAVWVKNNRGLWNLVYTIRNFIDEDFFNGSTIVRINPDNLSVDFGQGFDKDKFWNMIRPSAAAILYQEDPATYNKEWLPWNQTIWNGVVADGVMKDGGKVDGWYDFVEGSLNYVFYMLFSNLSNADFVKLYKAKTFLTGNNTTYKQMSKNLQSIYQDNSYKDIGKYDKEIS